MGVVGSGASGGETRAISRGERRPVRQRNQYCHCQLRQLTRPFCDTTLSGAHVCGKQGRLQTAQFLAPFN